MRFKHSNFKEISSMNIKNNNNGPRFDSRETPQVATRGLDI